MIILKTCIFHAHLCKLIQYMHLSKSNLENYLFYSGKEFYCRARFKMDLDLAVTMSSESVCSSARLTFISSFLARFQPNFTMFLICI